MHQQYVDFIKYKVVGSQTNHNFQKARSEYGWTQ